MRTYDFSPLWRSTVGFDRMFDLINNEVPTVQDTYPPYDIERTGEESYRISLALAGFTAEQVTVTAQQNRLTVAGRKGDNGKQDYIFQSIATRAFERHFSLADHVEVAGATFKNGLLQIDLVVELRPELRVLYTTGYGITNRMKAMFVPGSEFLPKPYDINRLAAKIAALIK